MGDKKVVSLDAYRRAKKKRKENTHSCVCAAKSCLAYARFFSKWIKENPALLTPVISYIQATVRFTIKAGVTLADIGTSREELLSLLSPPELRLSEKDKRRRQKMIDIPPYI